MNLVDSCGWLEFLANGPNATFFAPALKNTNQLLVPTLCIAEVFKRVLQQRGEDAALQVVALMQQGKIADLDTIIAMSAGKISGSLRLPLADSIIIATARIYHATIWTQDADFKGLQEVRFREKN